MNDIEKLTTEIDRLEKLHEWSLTHGLNGDYWDGYRKCLMDMKMFVNRLAGKELYINDENLPF